MDAKVPVHKNTRLMVVEDLEPESLQDGWSADIRQQESRLLTFWDTFEWGLWFGGYLLYSCGDHYQLCIREDGWPGAVVGTEEAQGRRRFWGDFTTPSMQAALKELLGLRGLDPVTEGRFTVCRSDLRNGQGKIVCRLEWSSVSAGQRGEEELLQTCCELLPLLGYESEAAQVKELLIQRGAQACSEGPLDLLLRHSNRMPQRYTLRPVFGLTADIPARQATGRIIRAIMEIATRNLPGIVSDCDTEFLHDYRICLRKIRSALSLLKGVYPAEATGRMRQLLGDLARQTNRLRDLDVYLLARDEYLALVPPVFRPALEEIFRDFSAERNVVLRRTVSKLRAKTHHQALQELETCFAEQTQHPPSATADLPVGPLVFRQISKRYRKIRTIAAEIQTDTPDELLHQLRIECKKLRYLMEFFSELIPAEEGEALQKLLRRLQGRLGEFNDASVQQKSLLAYWDQKKNGTDAALGLGGLISILYQRQQQTRSRIVQALEEFCGDSTATRFKQTFKRRASVSVTNAP